MTNSRHTSTALSNLEYCYDELSFARSRGVIFCHRRPKATEKADRERSTRLRFGLESRPRAPVYDPLSFLNFKFLVADF